MDYLRYPIYENKISIFKKLWDLSRGKVRIECPSCKSEFWFKSGYRKYYINDTMDNVVKLERILRELGIEDNTGR